MKRIFSGSLFTIIFTLLSVAIITAQGTCSAIIEDALSEMDKNCEGLERNSACYGYDLVQAAFLEEVADDFFAVPADIAGIEELETLATAGLNEANGTWGIAVMNIQANLPNTIPGQNVTFILMGDTEVENAVEPDETFNPSDGIDVTVNVAQGANVRSGPGLNFNVVGGVGGEGTVQADGQSQDGEWLRIAYNNRPVWISKTVLVEDPAFDELPILSPDLRTSMQAFFLRTGIGQPECDGITEDLLFVQGPNGIEIELEVNGANVTIGSSIGLRTITVNGELFLELIVFSGSAEVDGVSVPAGFRTRMCLSEPDNRGMDGESNDRIVSCAPSTPEPVEDFGEVFCYIEELPVSLMSYQVNILCPGETPPPSNNTPSSTTNASASQLGSVDCTSFGLVSPTDGIVSRPTDFVWTEAPGATRYEVVFYGGSGEVAETFFTEDTTINLNTGSISTGSEVAWEVRAFAGEEYACVTQRTPTFTRTVDPAFEPPRVVESEDGEFTASIVSCIYTSGHNVTIGWDGLANGETATFTISEVDGPLTRSGTSSSNSNTITLSLDTGQTVDVRASTTAGDNLYLGSCTD